MKKDDELPVIRAAYDFTAWAIPKIGKFPRDLRFTLGERIERQLLLILELLIRAKYAHENEELLGTANIELEILRFLLRLSHDLHALAFADDLAACFVLGTRDRLNGCLTIRCTKAREQPPTIEPTILDIDPDFATLRERPEYELDSTSRIVRGDTNEIDVDPDVWEEIQKLPGR